MKSNHTVKSSSHQCKPRWWTGEKFIPTLMLRKGNHKLYESEVRTLCFPMWGVPNSRYLDPVPLLNFHRHRDHMDGNRFALLSLQATWLSLLHSTQLWSCFAKWGRYANLKEHSMPHIRELATAQKWHMQFEKSRQFPGHLFQDHKLGYPRAKPGNRGMLLQHKQRRWRRPYSLHGRHNY